MCSGTERNFKARGGLFVENVSLLRTSTQLGMYIQNDEHFKNIIRTLLFKINGFESTYRVVNFSKQTLIHAI